VPGIRRRRCGRGFTYLDPEGETVRDPEERARFEALAIPPAWTDVWICPFPDGHVQATGRDDAGRKQYRYHPDWSEIRDQAKFGRLAEFGAALPRLRWRVERDLERDGVPRERVLAAVVRLLERSLIRVGNDEYARDNGSYGLTTLRRRHAEVDGDTVRFEFRGKSGLRRETDIDDPRLAEVVRDCQELHGQELFTYLDDEGRRCDVGSGDVNDYLREATGEEFTAKDFRTWAGTVLAVGLLRRSCDEDLTEREATSRVVAAVREVAERLGNTPATCRKFYVHPGGLDGFLDRDLRERSGGPRRRIPAASTPTSASPSRCCAGSRRRRRTRPGLAERLQSGHGHDARGPRHGGRDAPAARLRRPRLGRPGPPCGPGRVRSRRGDGAV
jgi:DNA topoisomerase-1